MTFSLHFLCLMTFPIDGVLRPTAGNYLHYAQKFGMVCPNVHMHPNMFCISCGFRLTHTLTMQLLQAIWKNSHVSWASKISEDLLQTFFSVYWMKFDLVSLLKGEKCHAAFSVKT